MKSVEIGSGSIGTVASGLSGFEIAGTLGGIAGTLIAAVTLTLSVIASNSNKRKNYADDIRKAEERGEQRKVDDLDRMERERDFWRAEALGGAHTEASPVDLRRRRPRPREDDNGGSQEASPL